MDWHRVIRGVYHMHSHPAIERNANCVGVTTDAEIFCFPGSPLLKPVLDRLNIIYTHVERTP